MVLRRRFFLFRSDAPEALCRREGGYVQFRNQSAAREEFDSLPSGGIEMMARCAAP
jgi:hypothetical protein